jgi:hypothetical protein
MGGICSTYFVMKNVSNSNKGIPLHASEVHGRGGVCLLILHLGIRCSWGVNFTPWWHSPTPKEGSRYPFSRWLGGLEPVYTVSRTEKSLSIAGIRISDRPARNPIHDNDWTLRDTWRNTCKILVKKTFGKGQLGTLGNFLIKYLYIFIITGFVFFLIAFVYCLWKLHELKHLGTRVRNKASFTKYITSKWESGSFLYRSVRLLSIRISACAEITFNHLKPTGYVIHQQVYHSTTVRPAHNAFVLYLSGNKQQLVPLIA